MLTCAEVEGLTRAFSPEGAGAAIAAVMPGWELVPDETGAIRIGGPAPLRPEEDWPREDRGVPLTFVAAIPIDALMSMPDEWRARQPLPELRGTIRVFADLASSPYESTVARVDLVPDGARLESRDPPPLPDPWPVADDVDPGSEGAFQDELDAEERVTRLDAARASAWPILGVDAVAFGERVPGDADLVALEGFTDAVRSTVDWGAAKVLGVPDEIQDDPRFLAGEFFPELGAPDDWVPLLELHATLGDALLIESGGAFRILVAAEDLRAGRFDRAVCDVAQG